MELVTSLALAGSIIASHSYDNSKDSAIKTLGIYQYRVSGLEADVKEHTKKILPSEFKHYGGFVVAIYSGVVNKQLNFRWSF